MISNKLYDILVKVQRFLPAIGAAYLGISGIWGLPFGDAVNETIAILATLLGAFIEVSIGVYNKQNNALDQAMMAQVHASLDKLNEGSENGTEG